MTSLLFTRPQTRASELFCLPRSPLASGVIAEKGGAASDESWGIFAAPARSLAAALSNVLRVERSGYSRILREPKGIFFVSGTPTSKAIDGWKRKGKDSWKATVEDKRTGKTTTPTFRHAFQTPTNRNVSKRERL